MERALLEKQVLRGPAYGSVNEDEQEALMNLTRTKSMYSRRNVPPYSPFIHPAVSSLSACAPFIVFPSPTTQHFDE